MNTKHILVYCIAALAMMSCDNPMSFRTKVNEDGSLEKTITFEKTELAKSEKNIFGVSEENGWVLLKTAVDSTSTKISKEKFRLQFKKQFTSSDAMNAELDKKIDTLFQVHSKFEKKFRWFYTYIRYSETIRPINRFKQIFPKDFFAIEDSIFIQRLPAEGKKISNADSVYLQVFNDKISNNYVNMGMFKEIYKVLEDVLIKNSLDKKWLDSLSKKQELIYQLIEKDQDGYDKVVSKIIDTLNIPLSKKKAETDFKELSRNFSSRIDFMSFARDGKYLNEFEMPWSVVTSNADSVAGNKLYWRPLVHKFIYMDYEMYAESRKINSWTVILSLVIVGLTVFAFRKKANT